MKVFVRTITPMGPRTTVHRGMSPEAARDVVLKASLEPGGDGAVVEDTGTLNLGEYMRANAKRSRRRFGLANVTMTPELREVLSNVLVKLERPRQGERA